jgi:hypothetical protein
MSGHQVEEGTPCIAGEIFLAAASCIQTQFGTKAWKKIIGDMKLPKLEADARYELSTLVTIVQSASNVLKVFQMTFLILLSLIDFLLGSYSCSFRNSWSVLDSTHREKSNP